MQSIKSVIWAVLAMVALLLVGCGQGRATLSSSSPVGPTSAKPFGPPRPLTPVSISTVPQVELSRTPTSSKPTATAKPPISVGAIAPDFQLQDLKGETVRLADHRGQPVGLVFFATWCGHCQAELPRLSEIYKTLSGQGLEILAVNLREDRGKLTLFAAENGLSFPVLMDVKGDVADLYGIRSIPTLLLIGSDGVVKKIFIGEVSEEQLWEGFRALLGQ